MQPFRFFDLPRELRDQILEHTIIPRLHTPSGYDANDSQIWVTNAPDPGILLANRQLSHEYREQLADRTRLLVVGAHCNYWMGFHHPEESLARATKYCTVFAHVLCHCDFMDADEQKEFEGPCDGADSLAIYQDDLLNGLVKELPNLQTLDVKIGLWCARDAQYKDADENVREPPRLSHTPEFKDYLKTFTSLPRLQKIEIARCTNDTDYVHLCEGTTLPTVATWTAAKFWHSQWV